MTWRANGNYYSFKEKTISFYAPSASGVYGLYNMRHQILIGNSANIKDALLRHLSETHFRFRRFTPTGFIFEVLPPESRELRAQELIREYKPILQPNGSIGLSALWCSWTASGALAFHPQVSAAKVAVSNSSQPSATDNEEQFKCLHSGREQFARIAVKFGAILAVLGVLALASHPKNASNVVWKVPSSMSSSVSELESSAPMAGVAMPGTLMSAKPLSEEAKVFDPNSNVQTSQQVEAAIERPKPQVFVNSDALANNGPIARGSQVTLLAAKQKAVRKAQSMNREEQQNGWAVQVMATTEKRIADHWLDNLKAKGYDAFLVRVDIRGQTWYRLRAGNFNTRQEAEALRTALKSKEAFHDAFIAANTGPETLVALKPK